MRNVAIIQARMSSRRFPGKVLADLAGEPLLARVVERTRLSRRLDQVLVATSRSPSDEPIADLCRRRGWDVFRGDEHDVLGRFASAARNARADRVVRITSDCPLVDGRLIDQALDQFDETPDLDYLSLVVGRAVLPAGFGVEVLKAETLYRLERDVHRTWWREHVTLYVRQYPDSFRTQLLRLEDEPADAGDWELSVDTLEDLERVRAIYERLATSDFSWREALEAARALARSHGPARDVPHPLSTGSTGEFHRLNSGAAGHWLGGAEGHGGEARRNVRGGYRNAVRDVVTAVLGKSPCPSLVCLGPRSGGTWHVTDHLGQAVSPSQPARDVAGDERNEAGSSEPAAGAGHESRAIRPTLLTVNRLGGQPSAEPFLEWLRGWPVRPARVIQVEPCWLPRRYGTEGARRNRWIVRRDGCRDLVMLLQAAPDIVLEWSELDRITCRSGRAFHLLVWKLVAARVEERYIAGGVGFTSPLHARGGGSLSSSAALPFAGKGLTS
jgi:spore coat polysaccharide biosynthesis protein SpsF